MSMEADLGSSSASPKKGWRDYLTNPFMLAVLGGFISVMTSIATTWYSTRESRIAENLRAAQSLQADLIKKAVESRVDDATKNLRFLAEVGLVPDYAVRIKAYLNEHPNDIPSFAPAQMAPSAWRDASPDQAFCFQRQRDGDEFPFLVRCFETNEGCTAWQTKDRGKKSSCVLSTELRTSSQWKEAGRGGIGDSWYRYSKTAFQKPFPQLP